MSEVSDSSNQAAKVINIDQLEKEIGNAEYYLGKSTGNSLKKETVVSATSISRSSFDDKRRADILLQFGRVPLDQSSSSSNTVAPRSSLSDSRPDSPKRNNALSKSTPSLTNSKYADPNEREKLVMRLLSDHAIKRNQQSVQQSSSVAVQSPARNSPKRGGGGSSSSFSPSSSGRSPNRVPYGASSSNYNSNINNNNNNFSNRAGSIKQSVSSEMNFAQTIDASHFESNSNSPIKSSAGGVVDGKDLSPDSMDDNDPSENNRSVAYSDDEDNSHNNSGMLFFASDLVDKPSHDNAYSNLNMNWESFPSTISNNNGSNASQGSQSKTKDAYMNSTIRNPSRDAGSSKHRYSNDSSIGNEDPSMMETMKWPSASDANRRSVSPPYGLSSSREIVKRAVVSKERPRSAPSRRGAAAQQGKTVATLDDAALETRARTTEWKYLKSRDVLKKEADESFNKEHVFKPQLVAEYNSITLSRRNPSSRIDEIRSRYHESLINREKRKKEEERLGMLEYTGKPQITKKAEEILKKRENLNNERRARDDSNVSRPNKDVAERLHEDAHARIVTQEYLKKSVDEARRTQYPFQPSLNPKNEAKVSPDYKPIYERISNVQKEKQYRLHQLKAELEDEQTELTFAPKIDAKSAQIVKLKANAAASSSASGVESAEHILNRHKDFGARLMQESIMLSKHRQKLIEDQERREAEMMQPPKVSKGSEAIAARRQEIQTPFDKRLEIYEEKSKLNSNRIRQDVDNEGSSWFKPSILAKSEKIVYKIQPGRENESPGQRDKRLSQWDALAIEQKKKMLEEELYGNIKFAPTIDQKSKEMVRKTDFRELVENHRGKRIKDTVRQKVEEMRGADCPFRPKITDYFEKAITKENVSHQILENELRHFGYNDCPTDVYDSHNRESNIDDPARKANLMSRVTINLKQPERMAGNIRHYLQEKEEKRRQALIERELDELRDCTFQPEVDPYAFKRKDSYLSEEPIIVRGLGRHLELKNRSQKLKEDAEAREREVFSVRNVDKIRRPEDGSTIIEPFSFSEISFRPSRAVEELIALEQSHLTYKPDTLEHRRQELIRRHTALMT